MTRTHFIDKTHKFCNNLNLDIVKKIYVYNTISSTNKKAKELANTNPEGTIIISKTQQQGRGRFERQWISPEGGLYLSIIIKPNCTPEKTTILPLIGSIAIAESINHYNQESKIKWPNDVRLNSKKISGILTESEGNSKQIKNIILGIGINLNIKNNQLPEELKKNTTTLSIETKTKIDYHEFLEKLLTTLDKYYKLFLDEDYETIIKKWKQHTDTIGKKVKIKTQTEEIKGIAIDIDQLGFLIIKTESDEIKKITSGDCHYLKML